MIYTVFPNDPNGLELPQDFETYAEAKEYGDSLGLEYVIESTTGNVV